MSIVRTALTLIAIAALEVALGQAFEAARDPGLPAAEVKRRAARIENLLEEGSREAQAWYAAEAKRDPEETRRARRAARLSFSRILVEADALRADPRLLQAGTRRLRPELAAVEEAVAEAALVLHEIGERSPD